MKVSIWRAIALAIIGAQLTGCTYLVAKNKKPLHIVDWTSDNNEVIFENGTTAHVVGNPRIVCYTRDGVTALDGYFMYISENNYLNIDEFGKRTIWISRPDPRSGNYCVLGGAR